MAKGYFGRALGTLVSPIVECVDVDGVVRRVDVNDLVQRVDIDALIDRVDINRHIERVDLDKLMDRIDVDKIVQRSNLGAIIAQSTSGVFSHIFDALRSTVVSIDLLLMRLSRCRCRDKDGILPPAPGNPPRWDRVPFPEGSSQKAMAVQGRYTGIFSKGLATVIDIVLTTLSFALLLIIIGLLLRMFDFKSEGDTFEEDALWVLIVFAVWAFMYYFSCVAMVGSTVGMALVGTRVVETSGKPVSAWRAALRTLVLPLSITFLPILGIIGFVRRDGRMLHDVVACTGIIYMWDARMACLREEKLPTVENV